MKFLLPAGCALMVGVAMPVWAACDPPPTGLTAAGAAEFALATSDCKPPNFSTDFGAMAKKAVEPVVREGKVWVPPARETARIAIPEPTDDPANAAPAEVDYDYTRRQAFLLGQTDANQGRPMNMKYVGNLAYLEGYTKAQEVRANGPVRAMKQEVSGGAGNSLRRTP